MGKSTDPEDLKQVGTIQITSDELKNLAYSKRCQTNLRPNYQMTADPEDTVQLTDGLFSQASIPHHCGT